MSGADGISINWRMFGAEVHPPWPGRQLHASLCHCAPADHAETSASVGQKTVKTFYRFAPGMTAGNHGPTLHYGSVLLRLRWLNGAGKSTRYIKALTILLAGEKGVHLTRSSSDPRFDWVQINHYFLRHPSLIGWRQARGRGSNFIPENPNSPVRTEFTERHSPQYYARFNRTDDEDRSILRHLPAVDREMARLLKDDSVRHWHEHAKARLAAYLAEASAAAE